MALRAVLRDEYSAPFFDGTAKGELRVRRCANGHYLPAWQGSTEGPSLRCHTCQSTDITWQPASGRGTLVSWIVLHLKEEEGGGVRLSGLVELEEGPWMYALLDVEPDAALAVGTALEVGFTPTDGGEIIPAFRLA
jgi:uncharacterized OB-fold protein